MKIKLKIVFHEHSKISEKDQASIVSELSSLMIGGMSGSLSDGSFLTIVPELTIVNAKEVDFDKDYHIEMVRKEHSQLPGGKTGVTFSTNRAITAYYFTQEYEEGGFILPNGDEVKPTIVEDHLEIPTAAETAFHELGHMLGLSHSFPSYDFETGRLKWDKGKSPYDFLKVAPEDVRNLWTKSILGDEEAKKQLSQLAMNYDEGAKNVPEGGGRKPGSPSILTESQRTQVWDSAVADQKKRLQDE